MSAATPQELPWLLLDALNSGKVDRVVTLYEPGGVVGNGERHVARGRDEITAAFAGLLERRPRFSLREADVTSAGNLGLIRTAWVMATAQTDGGDVVPLDTVLVVRRQDDGRWLVAIDRSERHDPAQG